VESTTWLIFGAALVALILFKMYRGYRSPRLLREAVKAVEAGAPVVDVRTREEFMQAHHPGALNIPVQELASATARLGDPGRPVVLYCRSGRRSGAAARILRDAGFTSVLDLGPYRNTHVLPVGKPSSLQSRIPSRRRRGRKGKPSVRAQGVMT